MSKKLLTSILATGVLIAVLVPAGPATAGGAADTAPRQKCASPQGAIPGTGGIYSLRATATSCRTAKLVVKKFHTKYDKNFKSSQMARGFSCTSELTGGYEGLMVSCKRGSSKVKWTAYLAM